MFDKRWFLKNQKLLLRFANSFIGRYFLRLKTSSVDSNKIIRILPNSITWKTGKYYHTEFRTHDKFAKRLYYSFKPLWYLFHLWDIVWYPKFNLGFDTLTAYPTAGAAAPVDGYVERNTVDESLATIIAGAGNASDASNSTLSGGRLVATATTDQYSSLLRSIYCFDTSALTASATISAAVFSVMGRDKTNGLGSPELDCVASTPAATNALANADYGQLGSTVFASVTYANWSTVAYNDFTLDANGRSNIDKTTANNTKFGLRLNWDTDGTGPTWANAAQTYVVGWFADAAGTDNDPKLVVTYTLPTGGNYSYFM